MEKDAWLFPGESFSDIAALIFKYVLEAHILLLSGAYELWSN